MNDAVLPSVWELDGVVGRLRRRVKPDSSADFDSGRVAHHVYALDTMIRPTAAQVAAMWAPGDEEAIREALELVDRHDDQLRRRLGLPEPCRGRPWHELNSPLTAEEQASWDRMHGHLPNWSKLRMGGRP